MFCQSSILMFLWSRSLFSSFFSVLGCFVFIECCARTCNNVFLPSVLTIIKRFLQ